MASTTAYSPTLSVRINDIDYTLSPSGSLDNTTLRRVPVLRIYGDSSTGQKACIHVHNVYPYFYVEYRGGHISPETVNRYIAKLFRSLNQALSVSLQRRPESRSALFVRAITLVKGVHFYGFHASYTPFLKVHLADPALISRAAAILRTGTVMGTRFRVFESHISYVLQFMCDFNLYGCGSLDLGEVWERASSDPIFTQTEDDHVDHFQPSSYLRQTRMPLEVDVAAHQILNRHRLTARNLHHELKIPAATPPSEPLVASVRELWDDERRRRVARGLPPSPDIPVDPSERSRAAGGDWVQEAAFWDNIRARIQLEGETEPPPAAAGAWERWVMTTFESIEALWEDEHKTWKPVRDDTAEVSELKKDEQPEQLNPFETMTPSPAMLDVTDDQDDVDVDETTLATQAVEQFIDQEQDWDIHAIRRERNADQDIGEDVAAHEDEDELTSTPRKIAGSALGSPKKTPSKRPFPVSQPSTPFRERSYLSSRGTPSKPANRFVNAFGQLAAPYVNLRPSPPPLPTTPTKPHVMEPHVLRSVSNTGNRVMNMLDAPECRLEDDMLPVVSTAVRFAPMPLEAEVSSPISSSLHDIKSATTGLNSVSAWPTQFALDNDELVATKKQKLVLPLPDRDSNFMEPSPFFAGVSITHKPLAPSSSHVDPLDTHPPPVHYASFPSYQYRHLPPGVGELIGTLEPSKLYQDPWYSVQADTPGRPREYAGLVYELKGGNGLDTLDDWEGSFCVPSTFGQVTLESEHGWEYGGLPPSSRAVQTWLEKQLKEARLSPCKPILRSQIQGPTQHSHGSKATPRKLNPGTRREKHNLTILCMELFAPSREGKKPDPAHDEIATIFYAFHDPDVTLGDDGPGLSITQGILATDCQQLDPRRLREFSLQVAVGELDLINQFVDLVCEMDPDIIAGWELQTASWGYFTARAQHLDLDVTDLISRAPSRGGRENRQWDYRQTSTFKIIGRHVLNVWRVMRSEQTLRNYTFENVAHHLLRERHPLYTSATLTEWFNSPVPHHAARLLSYFQNRTVAVLRMLDVAEVVTKTAEFARVFGVDFFSVLSRGSQYKVESFMLRIAKAESFVLLAPSHEDVGKQNAIECMPLIMEPLSAFYKGPLVVLDFQSLYPSIMIAYNYCYSTCLGRVQKFNGTWKFGVTELRLPNGLVGQLQDHISVAPNGIMYAKPHLRRGLLGRMLKELLETRVMVKQSMKGVKDDKALRRVLDARQLGLKFISNVTYGYTSATFSGRMPAVEIADSIVQSGRETLEKAISVINSTKKWGAHVVYGDTDSLFIYLPGKTKEQAFRIGYEMSDTVSAMNPAPIKLKFEKVYLPCVLMAKKRYVGWKYENPDDQEAVFDAKGIETVRRDGCIAQAKMTEQCLKILFRTQDLSKVKDYCYDSWSKILDQRVTIQDFVISKEVKMGTYSKDNPPLPGVTVAARRSLLDPNDEAQYGERVPYVIVRGPPGTKLLERAYDPLTVLNDPHKCLDAAYYLDRVLIPPLERIFNLVGADVRAWYEDMPKSVRSDVSDSTSLSPRKKHLERLAANRHNIEEHFYRTQCVLCGAHAESGLCDDCCSTPERTTAALASKVREHEGRLKAAQVSCLTCTTSYTAEPVRCESLDCPWFYERRKAESSMEVAMIALELI